MDYSRIGYGSGRIILIVLPLTVSLILVGCSKVYYKEFRVAETPIENQMALTRCCFNFSLSVSAAASSKVPLTDSSLTVSFRITPEKNQAGYDAVESLHIDQVALLFPGYEFDDISLTPTADERLQRDRHIRKISFGSDTIPESVDSLMFRLRYTYNYRNQPTADSILIVMRREDSHYTVPLGPILD